MKVRVRGKGKLGLLVPTKVSRKLRQNYGLLPMKWTVSPPFIAWVLGWKPCFLLLHRHPGAFPQTTHSVSSEYAASPTFQFCLLQGVAKRPLLYEAMI